MPKHRPGNPEWVEILEECYEREFARDPEGHGPQNTRKAINALRANPVTFERPAQAEMLKGIGKKTILKIEAGLRTRRKANDDPPAPVLNRYQSAPNLQFSDPPLLPKTTAVKKTAKSSANLHAHTSSSGPSSSMPDYRQTFKPAPQVTAKTDTVKKTLTDLPPSSTLLDDLNKMSTKKVVPIGAETDSLISTPGSAEAALLIALYCHIRDSEERDNWAELGLSTSEIHLQAAPYYIAPVDDSSVWYTKGLTSLVKKKYFKASLEQPVIFTFTMKGFKIAHQTAQEANIDLFAIPDSVSNYKLVMTNHEELDSFSKRNAEKQKGYTAAGGVLYKTFDPDAVKTASTSRVPMTKASSSKSKAPLPKRSESTSALPSTSQIVDCPSSIFEFTYIDEDGNHVKDYNDANSYFDDVGTLVYQIEYRTIQTSHPSLKHVIDRKKKQGSSVSEGPMETAFAYPSKIGLRSTGFTSSAPVATAQKTRPPLKASASAPAAVASTSRKRVAANSLTVSTSTQEDRDNAIRIDPPNIQIKRSLDQSGHGLRLSDLIEMQPGEYRIVLILDHRERETIRRLESIANLDMEARNLAVADAVWIAKRIKPTGRPEADELVLDFALERKRLTDLVGSIKNKRYDDQKVRMKTSGISCLLYLLENDSHSHTEINWEQQVWTVKSQVQVLDGFSILYADNFQKCLSIYKRLTTVVKELYQNKTIYGIPSTATSRKHYLSQLAQLRQGREATTILSTYDNFNELNAKQRTVRSEWAAMMFSQSQMSAEKVEAFVERFPTPIAFWNAVKAKREREEVAMADFESQPTKKKRRKAGTGEMFVMEMAGTEGSRGIKQKLSTDIWNIWTQSKYRE